jgi:nucleotide-binding universal stress UspA family protein
MKTILAPTDFSESAKNAINYAVEIAKLFKAKLILFHAFHIPAIQSEVPLLMPTDEIEKELLKTLNKIKKNIIDSGNQLEIECSTKLGFALDEINLIILEKQIDMVVMGVQGMGFLSEKLIGSLTTTLIRKAKCPVLTINENVKFKKIEKIALAIDYEEITKKSILKPLKDIIEHFKSHLYILNVTRELEEASGKRKTNVGNQLEQSFEKFEHSFNFIENDDLVEGINDFAKKNNIDIIVMIPRKHNILENIFKERNTKRMAFHANIPILALHE